MFEVLVPFPDTFKTVWNVRLCFQEKIRKLSYSAFWSSDIANNTNVDPYSATVVITTTADDRLIFYFLHEIRPDISCEMFNQIKLRAEMFLFLFFLKIVKKKCIICSVYYIWQIQQVFCLRK